MTNTIQRREPSEYFEPYKFKPATIMHDRPLDIPTEEWASLTAQRGGFNPVTKEMIPFTFTGETDLDYELDNITAALEAGVLHGTDWPQQIFSSEEQWGEFIEAIEEYFNLWRINDRWMSMLENLIGLYDEGEGLNGRTVADAFSEAVDTFYRTSEKANTAPDKKLDLTKKQREALSTYNMVMSIQVAKRGIPRDFATEPKYEDKFIEIVGNRLVVRPATMADVDALMARIAPAKPKAKAKAKATRLASK